MSDPKCIEFSGSCYDGEVEANCKHGLGIATYDVVKYEGQWEKGRRNAIGRETNEKVGTYEGFWKDG